jgi:hypothetical protein
MTKSIVALRLTRNLRYKLTYISIFETYLEAEPGPDVAQLLNALTEAQQTAIASLSRYLRRIEADTNDLGLDEKLMAHALGRLDVRSRLRFIHDGLERSVSWYKTQLMDRQMTADPELYELLFELGELDAAKLWRTAAVMGMLRISVRGKDKDWSEEQIPDPEQDEGWRPRLADDVGQTTWTGDRSSRWSGPPRSRRKDW